MSDMLKCDLRHSQESTHTLLLVCFTVTYLCPVEILIKSIFALHQRMKRNSGVFMITCTALVRTLESASVLSRVYIVVAVVAFSLFFLATLHSLWGF